MPQRCAVVPGEPDLRPTGPQQAAGIPCLRMNVAVGDAPTRGPADAPVTVVMFSDFECPFCVKGYETVQALEAKYGEKVRFVYKAFPIDRHPHALIAAMVAHSAQQQGRFWQFHDKLFSGEALDMETIARYGQESGLDMGAVDRDIEVLAQAPSLRRDMRQARLLGVDSTPFFFVNGRPMSGAQPEATFRTVIDEEIELALALQSSGVQGSRVYERLTANGYTEIVYEGRRPRLDEAKIYPVELGNAPFRGPRDADITVVSFGDLQCPYCARGHETLRAIEARFEGRIRVVHKNFPLPMHDMAFPAARAVMAAGEQGKLWPFLDAIYERGGRFDERDFELIAVELGLDMAKFESDRRSERYDAQIQADLAQGAQLGVTGTPAYFINGRPLDGARPELDFRMAIAEELERVQAARKAGVSAAKLYDYLISPTSQAK